MEERLWGIKCTRPRQGSVSVGNQIIGAQKRRYLYLMLVLPVGVYVLFLF